MFKDPNLRSSTQKLGAWLIRLGLVGLAVAVGLVSFKLADNDGYSPGALTAASFFTVMIGLAFVFPKMLEDENKGLSTMRVLVFMIVSVFVILTIKIGWDAKDLDELKIDDSWLYIIGLTLGGKVAQSIAEKFGTSRNTAPTPPPAGAAGSTERVDPPRGLGGDSAGEVG